MAYFRDEGACGAVRWEESVEVSAVYIQYTRSLCVSCVCARTLEMGRVPAWLSEHKGLVAQFMGLCPQYTALHT